MMSRPGYLSYKRIDRKALGLLRSGSDKLRVSG